MSTASVTNCVHTRVVPKVMSNFFFACELGTTDEGEYGDRWNQLLCYPSVSCDINSLHHVTSITLNKMADNDMSFRQGAVIKFLVKEEIPAAEIHQRLQRAYGSVCMGASSVRRWMKHFKDGKNGGNSESSASVSSDGWNGVLPQGEFLNFQNAGRNVYKGVAIMWKNKESYVD